MIEEIKSVKFSYAGKIDIDETYQKKIMDNWSELIKRTDLLQDGKILVVSNFIKNEDDYEIELKETTFSHFMYAKTFKNLDIRCMFSGAYIVTADNYVVAVLNNMYKGNMFEMLNLVGGMSDVKDIIDGKYSSEQCLKREFKEELGLDLINLSYNLQLKYIKYPSESENPFGYAIGTIYEVKTGYTKTQIQEMFENSKHDNEIKNLVFFSKGNYKDIYNFEHKKEYMPELWEKIFMNM